MSWLGRARTSRQTRQLTLTNRKIDILHTQVLIGTAVEAGQVVEELVEEPGRIPQIGPGVVFRGLVIEASIMAVNWRMRRKVTPQRRERIAVKTTEFAAELKPAAEIVGDPDLVHKANMATGWSEDLRSGATSVGQVYFDVKAVLGDLRREQTRLTLEAMREG